MLRSRIYVGVVLQIGRNSVISVACGMQRDKDQGEMARLA